MSSDIADNLRDARLLISAPDGWTQHRYSTGRSYCAIGAIIEITDSAIGPEVDFLDQAIGLRSRGITAWNDDHGRTQEEVVAAFTKAIKLAEAAHASP